MNNYKYNIVEAAGGADKTCTRDGCTGTLHVDLPKLGGEGYVKGEDSATCAGGGMFGGSIAAARGKSARRTRNRAQSNNA